MYVDPQQFGQVTWLLCGESIESDDCASLKWTRHMHVFLYDPNLLKSYKV